VLQSAVAKVWITYKQAHMLSSRNIGSRNVDRSNITRGVNDYCCIYKVKEPRQCLAFLDRKAYSYQWDVPEETHRRVMQQLRTRSFPEAYSVKVEVLVWVIENIHDFVQLPKD